MKLSTLDKVFINYLVVYYGDNLSKIGVTQVMDLQRAFYAGAKIMVEAASQEPPLSFEEGQGLLDNIAEFQSHIKDEHHNRIICAAILVQAEMSYNNGASKN